MTKDEILEMWKNSGDLEIIGMPYSMIATFSKMVAEREREACAMVCEAQEDDNGEWDIQQQCANAIRARGQA
jgi:hypothetical protein